MEGREAGGSTLHAWALPSLFKRALKIKIDGAHGCVFRSVLRFCESMPREVQAQLNSESRPVLKHHLSGIVLFSDGAPVVGGVALEHTVHWDAVNGVLYVAFHGLWPQGVNAILTGDLAADEARRTVLRAYPGANLEPPPPPPPPPSLVPPKKQRTMLECFAKPKPPAAL